MSQIDNHTSVHDDEDDSTRHGDDAIATAAEQPGTRSRGTSKRAPAAGKSSARKRKASSSKSKSNRSRASSTSSAKKARSTTDDAGDGATATDELRVDGTTEAGEEAELRGEPAVASAEVTTSEDPIDPVDADERAVDEVAVESPDASADESPAKTLDPEYLATLPPPPTARPSRRARPERPVRPASREPVIDLDDAARVDASSSEGEAVATGPAKVTVDPADDDDLPLPLVTRAQFWLRRQLHIPSDDPAYLATLPPPPAAAIDLRGTEDADDEDVAAGYRRIEVPSLVAEERTATTMTSAASPSASVPDSAEEHPVRDASAPTMAAMDPPTGSSGGDEPPIDRGSSGSSAGTTTDLGDDGEDGSITASSGAASVDTSAPDIVDLDGVQDPTESITLPDEEDGRPRWVGRTDDAFTDDLVEAPAPTTIEPAVPVDDRDDEDDTVVARAPKQSRAERRKEWRKVEQARRYAARRSVRFPILTRSILLWCLIFALAGMAAGGTAALFWSHFNTEIAELREKTDDFEKRSQTAEARIEALRQQAVDDINRGKAELAPALAERGVVQAAEFLSPFVWFVDTLDDSGRPSVGTAFAVSTNENETFLITSFNTVKSSTVRPSPEINLRKGGDVIGAEFVKWDAERDLALLRIDRGTQAVLDWADDGTQRQQLGGRVYVINGLGGAGASVNSGVVSDQIAQGFMHDARLGGQSQGAPVVTAEGKVIGVASMSYRPLNIDTGDLRYSVRIDMACERLLDCSTVARRPRG